MEGLKLIDVRENETINKQVGRGRGEQNPFGSKEFKAANKISLDLTYMFDEIGRAHV